jgi:hypothetical protein
VSDHVAVRRARERAIGYAMDVRSTKDRVSHEIATRSLSPAQLAALAEQLHHCAQVRAAVLQTP